MRFLTVDFHSEFLRTEGGCGGRGSASAAIIICIEGGSLLGQESFVNFHSVVHPNRSGSRVLTMASATRG